jgi:hypothetical protein
MELGARAKLLLLLWTTCYRLAPAGGLSGYTSVIEVTNGGPWGDWAWPEMCPDGFFASGFSIKVRARACVVEGSEIRWAAEPRMAIPRLLSLPRRWSPLKGFLATTQL